MLSQKEALASNMMANEEKMQEMRDKYEKSLASLQEELATLQQEKDKLDIQTKSSKNNDPTCKISEQRRKRIQDLENQVSTSWNAIKQKHFSAVFYQKHKGKIRCKKGENALLNLLKAYASLQRPVFAS